MQARSERSQANDIYEKHKGRVEELVTSELLLLARNLVGDRLARTAAELRRRASAPSPKRQEASPSPLPPEDVDFEPPTGKCQVCRRRRARGYITRGLERLRACSSCIEAEHPVVRKPWGEGSIGFGGGSTNPYARNRGSCDDGTD